jgi:hypothetical protein
VRRGVVADELCTGLVDEVDLVVSPFPSGDAEPVESERGAGQERGILEVPRQGDHRLEGLASLRELAGALLLDAEIEGDRSSPPGRVVGNQLQSVAVVACRFLRGKPPGCIAGGIEHQSERGLGVDIRDGETSVVGSVCRDEPAPDVR